jgi:hypothetical protein
MMLVGFVGLGLAGYWPRWPRRRKSLAFSPELSLRSTILSASSASGLRARLIGVVDALVALDA